MKNLWLTVVSARKLAAKIQVKYCGQSLRDNPNLIDEMTNEISAHPELIREWGIEIHWDDTDCVAWVQVGLLRDWRFHVPR